MNLAISDERLNKIKACEKEIRKTHRDFSYSNIPLDDEQTFELFSCGNTDGIEEFQSNGDKKWLKHYIKPRNIEELTAFYAMYRPGSMANLPAYVEGKNNPNGITYLESSFKDILAPTYGILVYREQLVQLVHDYCGCSIEDANKIRLRLQKSRFFSTLTRRCLKMTILSQPLLLRKSIRMPMRDLSLQLSSAILEMSLQKRQKMAQFQYSARI